MVCVLGNDLDKFLQKIAKILSTSVGNMQKTTSLIFSCDTGGGT